MEDGLPGRNGSVVNWPMVIVGTSPTDRVVGPLPSMAFLWLINGGDPNHLLTGMILQAWKTGDMYGRFNGDLPWKDLNLRKGSWYTIIMENFKSSKSPW